MRCLVIIGVLALLPKVALAQDAPVTIKLNAMSSLPSAARANGTATITPSEHGVTITLSVKNLDGDGQKVLVRSGTCGRQGPGVRVLASLSSGESTTQINLTMSDLVSTPHAIDVLNSPFANQEASHPDVVCGNIVAK
jgi:hypothetical protein